MAAPARATLHPARDHDQSRTVPAVCFEVGPAALYQAKVRATGLIDSVAVNHPLNDSALTTRKSAHLK